MKAKVNRMTSTAFLALILLSGNVNATGTETNVVSALDKIAEIKLELENWMVNDTYWVKAEAEPVLEVWMMQINNWKVKLPELTMEAESQLILEPWMMNELFWNRKFINRTKGA